LGHTGKEADCVFFRNIREKGGLLLAVSRRPERKGKTKREAHQREHYAYAHNVAKRKVTKRGGKKGRGKPPSFHQSRTKGGKVGREKRKEKTKTCNALVASKLGSFKKVRQKKRRWGKGEKKVKPYHKITPISTKK